MTKPAGPKLVMRRSGRSSAPAVGSGLQSMVWPLSADQFFSVHWERRPFVAHGPAARVGALSAALPSLEVAELARVFGRTIDVAFPKPAGRVEHVQTPPGEAAAHYAAGRRLYFYDYAQACPPLQEWFLRLCRDLDVPARGGCDLFVAGGGGGTRCHFDVAHTITVQLRGRKTWLLAPNRTVSAPTRNWSLGDDVPDELQLYASGPFPSAMPAPRRRVTLRPGSILYLPPGYFHATTGASASISVVFRFNPEPLANHFVAALRACLVREPGWRRALRGPVGTRSAGAIGGSGPELAEFARRACADLLATLTPAPPLGPIGRQRFVRNSNTTCVVERRGHKTVASFTCVGVGGAPRRDDIELPRAGLPALRWIVARGDPFRLSDLRAAVRGSNDDALRPLLRTLVHLRFIRVA